MVLAVLSSRMSAGGCSLAGRRDIVPCLAITAKRFNIVVGVFIFRMTRVELEHVINKLAEAGFLKQKNKINI